MAETTEKAPRRRKSGKAARPRAAPGKGKGKEKGAAGAVDHAPKAAEGTPRLQEFYEQDGAAPSCQKEFGLTNPHQVPRLVKIVLNVGMGDASKNPKQLEAVVEELG